MARPAIPAPTMTISSLLTSDFTALVIDKEMGLNLARRRNQDWGFGNGRVGGKGREDDETWELRKRSEEEATAIDDVGCTAKAATSRGKTSGGNEKDWRSTRFYPGSERYFDNLFWLRLWLEI